MSNNIMNMQVTTKQSKYAASHFSGGDYVVMNDCATGIVEIVIDCEKNGECWHGFGLELKFNASFNSNLKNSGAILISGLKVLNALTWYENSGSVDLINYEIGTADKDMIELTIKQHIVDRIKEQGTKTILRNEVLDIVFIDEVAPDKRSYGDGLNYVDVKYTSEHEIDIHGGKASGTIPFIIEGKRKVTVDFEVEFNELEQRGSYLGGKLIIPKVQQVVDLHITKLAYRGWLNDNGFAVERFTLTPLETMLIKQGVVDQVKEHYYADAYPQGKDHYLAN